MLDNRTSTCVRHQAARSVQNAIIVESHIAKEPAPKTIFQKNFKSENLIYTFLYKYCTFVLRISLNKTPGYE